MYLFALLPLMAACDDDKEPTPAGQLHLVFVRSYVPAYDGGKWVFSYGGGFDDVSYETTFCVLINDSRFYVSSDLSKKEDEDAAAFWRLAQRNRDTSYNREIDWALDGRTCYVHNLKAIHVVCTDQALGEAYPAGASLDAVVSARLTSYGAYVDSGYTFDGDDLVDKRLPDMTETDLKMVSPRIDFTLHDGAAFARQTTYTMRVTLVTTDDEEIVAEGKVYYY